jgi:hypothetical protein
MNRNICLCLVFLCSIPYSTSLGKEPHPRNNRSINKSEQVADSLDLPIPLAPNIKDLPRPLFYTTHLDFSLGLAFADFEEIGSFTGSSTGMNIPVSLLIDVPLDENGQASFHGGWDFALGGIGGGSLYTASTYLLYRFDNFPSFKPLAGFGAARTWYSYSGKEVGTFGVNATISYSIFILGLNMAAPQRIDAIITIPLRGRLDTEFEGKSFSIRPAGIKLSLLVSL